MSISDNINSIKVPGNDVDEAPDLVTLDGEGTGIVMFISTGAEPAGGWEC